jgi:RNA-directed DNA polymerase
VDLAKGGSFGFLGFDSRRVRSRTGKWRAHQTPKLKKRTELQRRLREVFRSHQSQPVGTVIPIINPILKGWVNYFAFGHSERCFSYVRDWVEKKVRRHLESNAKRSGFGWKRWSKQWLYSRLGLFDEYRLTRRPQQKALPVG